MEETFLGIPVDVVDEDAALDAARAAVAGGSPLMVVAVNPEKVMRAAEDPELREFIEQAGLRIPDGVGLVLASRLRGGRLRSRVTGIDLMLALLRTAEREGWRVYLLGGRPDVVAQARAEIVRRFREIRIVGSQDGYFDPSSAGQVAQEIAAVQPDILFAALGSPGQERFLRAHGQTTGARVLMGVGGSFDVLAGKVPRAPHSMRAVGLEWLYRLYREPWRLRRMLVLPVFLLRAMRYR